MSAAILQGGGNAPEGTSRRIATGGRTSGSSFLDRSRGHAADQTRAENQRESNTSLKYAGRLPRVAMPEVARPCSVAITTD